MGQNREGAERQLRIMVESKPSDDQRGRSSLALDPNSLETLTSCRVEPGLADTGPGDRYQFERQGYFCVDSVDSSKGALVFNRIVSLRDTWAKIEKARKKD